MEESTKVQKLREDLEAAHEALERQDKFIKEIVRPPFTYAMVVDVVPDAKSDTQPVIIALGGKMMEMRAPKKLQLKSGLLVKLNEDGLIAEAVSFDYVPGEIGYVKHIVDERHCEVTVNEQTRIVIYEGAGKVDLADRVLLDESSSVITNNLGKEANTFKSNMDGCVNWSDIGGLEEAKQQIREVVELPHKNPDIFKKYWKKPKPAKGILLYGPPGCGKTMMGKAIASSIAEIYKGDATTEGFIYVKGPEILDKYVGVAEATIRSIFKMARDHKRGKGYPAVVFIDEADAVLGKRGSGISSDIERTIVPMFLTEMDGMEDSGALVILATNRVDILDPAVVREGRIDRKIRIDRPDEESAKAIFQLNLANVLIQPGCEAEKLARHAQEQLFLDEHAVARVHTSSEGIYPLTLGDICSGGMIATVVEQAGSLAIQRELAGNVNGDAGVNYEDLSKSVAWMKEQHLDVNHRSDIDDFAERRNISVTKVERV